MGAKKDASFFPIGGMSLPNLGGGKRQPKRGLRLDVENYNHIVHHRYLAKKRKMPNPGFA